MSPRGRNFAVRLIVPLLAAGTLVAAPAAFADSGNSTTKAALATERYLSSYGDPVCAPADDAALATERYPELRRQPPHTAPSAPPATEVASSSGPSWTSAILAGIALAIAAGLAGICRRTRHQAPRSSPRRRARRAPRSCGARTRRTSIRLRFLLAGPRRYLPSACRRVDGDGLHRRAGRRRGQPPPVGVEGERPNRGALGRDRGRTTRQRQWLRRSPATIAPGRS